MVTVVADVIVNGIAAPLRPEKPAVPLPSSAGNPFGWHAAASDVVTAAPFTV
jgi:hypothetical protein